MTELRDLIAQRLIGDGNQPWADRVVETHAMDPDQGLPPFGTLPWIVIRQVGTLVDLDANRTEAFEVWIHAPAVSFAALDVLERLAIALLGASVLVDDEAVPPRVFPLTYAGTLMGDQVIEPWDAYARGLRFTSHTGALGGPDAHDDPRAQWLRFLGLGLFDCFGQDWCLQFAPNAATPPTDDCPLVWIRPLLGPRFVVDPPSNFWMTWYAEQLAVHVIAPSLAARDLWVDRLALALPRVAHGPDGDTWFLTLLSSDYTADPEREGQIVLEVRFAELSCAWRDTYLPMREAVAALPNNVAVATPPPSQTHPRPEPILPQGGRRS